MCRYRKLTPIFDTAYHGLASGDLDKDATAPWLFIYLHVKQIIIQSFEATMSLYEEKLGALHIVCTNNIYKLYTEA